MRAPSTSPRDGRAFLRFSQTSTRALRGAADLSIVSPMCVVQRQSFVVFILSTNSNGIILILLRYFLVFLNMLMSFHMLGVIAQIDPTGLASRQAA